LNYLQYFKTILELNYEKDSKKVLIIFLFLILIIPHSYSETIWKNTGNNGQGVTAEYKAYVNGEVYYYALCGGK